MEFFEKVLDLILQMRYADANQDLNCCSVK